jgi:uncharacterized protein YbjT (DUF2867 family)
MILVTGASGTVGSEVVRELQKGGATFRAAFHSPEKAEAARANGIDAVVIDFDDAGSLASAMQGIDSLFLVANGPDQARREIDAVHAAKAAGVRRIVKLSVTHAETQSYSFAKIHRAVEAAIEASGLTFTYLRPNGFMQNLGNYMIGTIRSQGAFYSSVGDTPIAHVDVRDIAEVAAAVLTQPGHDDQAYTLHGASAVTYAEIAAKLSATSGREIRYVAVTDADVKAAIVGSGGSADYADAFVDLLRFYRTGAASSIEPGVRQVLGRDPRSFDDYARDYASLFRGE